MRAQSVAIRETRVTAIRLAVPLEHPVQGIGDARDGRSPDLRVDAAYPPSQVPLRGPSGILDRLLAADSCGDSSGFKPDSLLALAFKRTLRHHHYRFW